MKNPITTTSKCLLALVAIASAILTLCSAPALAEDYTIKVGSIDVTVFVTLRPFEGFTLQDIADIAYSDTDLKVYYVRDGVAATQIPTATQTVTGNK